MCGAHRPRMSSCRMLLVGRKTMTRADKPQSSRSRAEARGRARARSTPPPAHVRARPRQLRPAAMSAQAWETRQVVRDLPAKQFAVRQSVIGRASASGGSFAATSARRPQPPLLRGRDPDHARERGRGSSPGAGRPARREARESSRRGPQCASGALPGAHRSLEAGMISPKPTFRRSERPAPRRGASTRLEVMTIVPQRGPEARGRIRSS